MIKRIILLGFCLIALAGCKASMGRVVPSAWEEDAIGESGEVVTATPGQVITMVFTGERSKVLRVHNSVHGEDAFATVEYPAAAYGGCSNCLEEDSQYYYFHHPENGGRLKVVGGNTMWSRAGYRASKTNPSDVVPFRYVEFGDPVMKATPAPDFDYGYAVNLKGEYHYKEITFVSCEDDILTLRRAEEQGPSEELGSKEQQMTLQFDLLESKKIEMEGARFTVVEAAPDRLVVKVVKAVTF
ncbi:hypothetical protein [Salidesulfovibrio brasiliensis]|uniref:hypothetical protein n=1 Tax=Salidesulfovibrio brasiliensis TaxID=221711 RepID=UPI0006D07E8C|nr:hypothetical protein [Salidesulfovibrio brasiliensis]